MFYPPQSSWKKKHFFSFLALRSAVKINNGKSARESANFSSYKIKIKTQIKVQIRKIPPEKQTEFFVV